MADTWTVVRRRNDRESVVFDGTEKDARKFLQNNYPRLHVEPGSPDSPTPDALLKSPSGSYSAFHGDETGYVDTDKNGEPKKEKTTAAKKTAAKKSTQPPNFGGSDNDNGGNE